MVQQIRDTTGQSGLSGKVVFVDGRAVGKAGEQAAKEDGFPVVSERPEFEAAVEQET